MEKDSGMSFQGPGSWVRCVGLGVKDLGFWLRGPRLLFERLPAAGAVAPPVARIHADAHRGHQHTPSHTLHGIGVKE